MSLPNIELKAMKLLYTQIQIKEKSACFTASRLVQYRQPVWVDQVARLNLTGRPYFFFPNFFINRSSSVGWPISCNS